MDQVVAASTSQRRLALVLFGAFAVAALLLSIAGIYGVLAGSVSERTREIGVRSALGATPSSLIGLIVGQGGRLAAIGIVLGIGGSFALTRYLQSLLFGVAPNDPATLAGRVPRSGGRHACGVRGAGGAGGARRSECGAAERVSGGHHTSLVAHLWHLSLTARSFNTRESHAPNWTGIPSESASMRIDALAHGATSPACIIAWQFSSPLLAA